MTVRDHPTYVLGAAGIRQAPRAAGIYAIVSQQHWVYIGESDDIRNSLFRHLHEPDPCMGRFGALSFRWQLAPSDQRAALWRSLMTRLKPECNSLQNPASQA